MRSPPEDLGDFRLADIVSFLAVRRCGSITAAARELKVTPSQVSKAVARLEEQIGLPLLSRGARGVVLSDDAQRLVPHLMEVVGHWRSARRARAGELRELTIAAPSYLNLLLVPRIAAGLPGIRLRDLEMPPPLIRAFIDQNFFDMTFVLGKTPLPDSWESTCAGEIRKALFAAPALAQRLGPQPLPVERLKEVPFISPIHNFNGQFVPVDDDCPLRFGDRRLGDEVQTIGTGLEVASHTEQVVFGPALAARRHVEAGTLVEVAVRGWQVSEPLYVACNIHRILASDLRAIVEIVRGVLAPG